MAHARMIVGAATLAVLGGTVMGCTSGTNPEPSPGPETPAASSASPTDAAPLQVAVYGDRRRLRVYERIAAAYEASDPGAAEVELTRHPDADAALTRNLISLDQGWDPDVFLADDRQLPDLVASDGLEPVDTMLEDRGLEFGDDFQRVALTSFSANDRLQCMPAEVSPLVLYYNKPMLRRAQAVRPVLLPTAENPTWAWEDFVTLARAIAGLDQLGPVKGAWFPADVATLTAFLRSAGTDVVDDVVEPTSLNLTSEEALEVVDALASFARDPSVAVTPAEAGRRDPVARFAAGELGMLVGTRDDLPRLRAADGLSFDVLPLPGFGRSRSVSFMNAWCVNGSTEQVGAASDFVAFAVGPEGAAIAARSGAIVPSGLDAIAQPAFLQPRKPPAGVAVYGTAIRRSEPMPYSPVWNLVAADVEEVLARLYTTPDIDLAATLPGRMARLNERSVALFQPVED